MDCIFCNIIKGEIPSYKIYEDNFVYAFLDIASDYYGHTIVIPKVHSTNVLDIESKSYSELMLAIKKISKHYVNDCNFTGVNIFNNSGLDAEQSVMHTHFHIVPRVSGDGYKINPASVKQNFDLNKIANELKLN